MPTAIEKSELIQFHLVRNAYAHVPQFAWGEWLDLHASVAGVQRKPPGYASGEVTVTGERELLSWRDLYFVQHPQMTVLLLNMQQIIR